MTAELTNKGSRGGGGWLKKGFMRGMGIKSFNDLGRYDGVSDGRLAWAVRPEHEMEVEKG